MVSGSLALLYFLIGFHGGRQGSGPDRGHSPVEWGNVCLSVHLSVHPSVCPSVRPSIRPSVRPSIRPSVRPSVRPAVVQTALLVLYNVNWN